MKPKYATMTQSNTTEYKSVLSPGGRYTQFKRNHPGVVDAGTMVVEIGGVIAILGLLTWLFR